MLLISGVFLTSAVLVPPAAAAPSKAPGRPAGDGLARALSRGDIDEAQHALYRALALFRPALVEARFGRVAAPGPRDATPILRELAARTTQLSGSERSLAEQLLARPTDRRDQIKAYRSKARHKCDPTMCFWWVTKGADAPPLRDRRPRNGVPDQVDLTRAMFRQVWNTEVRSYGYPRPRSDIRSRNHGPNGKLDIYLADIGGRGLYGYCTTDDPRRSRSLQVSAYCVVDDDFAARQFAGGVSGKPALQVTAAHEFFHAVQFALDWLEDLLLMEGTATWIEDEVFTLINDNFQYLPTSPISATLFWLSLDHDEPDFSRPESGFKYGAWIFFRYLSERFGREVVRDAWNAARGAPYAIQAVQAALAARGQSFADLFHQFGVANFFPVGNYSEAALYLAQPGVGPRPSGLFNLSPAAPLLGTQSIPMPHLSNDYYAFAPGTGVDGDSTLQLTVDALAVLGGRAAVFAVLTDGSVQSLGEPAGPGTPLSLPFHPSVAAVVLVLTNPSAIFGPCGTDVAPPFFSCFGEPLSDATFTFSAVLVP